MKHFFINSAVALALLACGSCSSKPASTPEQMTRDSVLTSMKQATRFMMDSVSNDGAFVWNYLTDMSRMWGELEAPKRTMVWIQPPGTPSMAHMFLDAYHATGDEYYYEQALKVAKLLASVQHPEGGWNYVEDTAGEESLKEFYATIGKQAWRLEEFQHYYGNCTFDDEATAVCAKLMLRVYLEKKDPVIKESLDKVIKFVLDSQYENGGWPQRFPLMYTHPFRGKEDYSSFVTLNDDVMPDNIEFLTMCCQELGREDLREPIDRALKLSLKLQQPAPLSGWADQYFVKTLKPAHARSYEPRAVNTGTTVRMIRAMFDYYRWTGDKAYLDAVPAALTFLENQRLPEDVVARWERKRPNPGDAFLAPRFLNPEDGRPLYVHREGSNVGTGHYFTTDEISGTIAHYSSAYYVNPKALRKQYEELLAMPVEEATAGSELLYPDKNHALDKYYYGAQGDITIEAIRQIMSEQKPNGSWITPLFQMSNPFKPLPEGLKENHDKQYAQTYVGDEYDMSPFTEKEPVDSYSTKNYIKVMSQMIHWLENN